MGKMQTSPELGQEEVRWDGDAQSGCVGEILPTVSSSRARVCPTISLCPGEEVGHRVGTSFMTVSLN